MVRAALVAEQGIPVSRKALLGLAAVLVAALAGCSESQNLAETGWRLDSLGEAGVVVVVDAVVTLDFVTDGRVTGETGCNSFNGPYQSDGDAISIGPLAMARAACPDPARAVMETAYLAALERAETDRIDEHVLTLLGSDDRVLAELARFDPTLEGSSWTVLAYNNGNQAVVSVILDTQITVVFGDDGSISRSGGGNDYTGPYETEDQRIAIGPSRPRSSSATARAVSTIKRPPTWRPSSRRSCGSFEATSSSSAGTTERWPCRSGRRAEPRLGSSAGERTARNLPA
jgi:heat shock protein HslJ